MFIFNLHVQLILKRYSILNPASFIDCKVLSCRGCIKNCEHVCVCVCGLLDEGRNCILQCGCVMLGYTVVDLQGADIVYSYIIVRPVSMCVIWTDLVQFIKLNSVFTVFPSL
jgi:hypothetical protein